MQFYYVHVHHNMTTGINFQILMLLLIGTVSHSVNVRTGMRDGRTSELGAPLSEEVIEARHL